MGQPFDLFAYVRVSSRLFSDSFGHFQFMEMPLPALIRQLVHLARQ